MRVTIAAIGRDRTGPTRDLFEDYRRRSPWPIRLVEIAPRSSQPIERRLRRRGRAAAPGGAPRAVLVALDERAASSTARLRGRIAGWQGRLRQAGLSDRRPGRPRPRLLERAEASLRLGRMTWPHRLVRVLLAEQLYRASTILSGHPYHRD